MIFRIGFLDQTAKTVEADCHLVDDQLLVFMRAEQPVLTCILRNVAFFEALAEEPAKSSRQEARGDLFSSRLLS